MSLIKKAYALHPMFGACFESFLFGIANAKVMEYNGGQWKSAKCGPNKELSYQVIPCKESTMTNNGNMYTATMDAHTAGAVISVLAFNQAIWRFHQARPDSPLINILNEFYYSTLNAILNDQRVNAEQFNSMID